MSDAFTTTDVFGRDEETSMYIALLERQVVGLTLANIRQKATIDANTMQSPDIKLVMNDDAMAEEVCRKLRDLQKSSERMNRRTGV